MGRRDFSRPIREVPDEFLPVERVRPTWVRRAASSSLVRASAVVVAMATTVFLATCPVPNPGGHGLTRSPPEEVAQTLRSPLPSEGKRAAATERQFKMAQELIADIQAVEREGGQAAVHARIFLKKLSDQLAD